MQLPSLEEIHVVASVVYRHMSPTPQLRWPLLRDHCGCEVWVKHENHTPIGSFKIRGGLNYIDKVSPNKVIAATRGNHGQSVAYACRAAGISATVVMPRGNSVDKNTAMRALGATLVEHGDDFNDSLEYAMNAAREQDYHFMPSFDPNLALGVATYGVELFQAVPALEAVYVPVGLGSGICGVIAAREALGLDAEIIGVVAENAPAYSLSFERKELTESDSANTFADGIAVRIPSPEALEIILRNASRVVQVSEAEIADAMRLFFSATHNVVEGAGSATLAALVKEKDQMAGRCVAVIASGGNIDSDLYSKILACTWPKVD